MRVREIIQGDVLEVLRKFPDESIDCIVTSPPYWGLRDYGEGAKKIWDGDPGCEHEWESAGIKKLRGTDSAPRKEVFDKIHLSQGAFCRKCGAWYGQLGLEPTLELYLDHMLEITKELKRVLKGSGVMFWNHGDNYGGSNRGIGDYRKKDGLRGKTSTQYRGQGPCRDKKMRDKCLALQNYRLIIRMIDEQGWILRNTIIWDKPNAMPSSVKDRFTNKYEPVFLLVKSRRYWFDLDAVRVPSKTPGSKHIVKNKGEGAEMHKFNSTYFNRTLETGTHKNPGDVWTIPTQPFPEAHFATFPERLIEPMIKAGCPQWICKKCGRARERVIERRKNYHYLRTDTGTIRKTPQIDRKGKSAMTPGTKAGRRYREVYIIESSTIGWTDCGCNAGWRPGIVLDPFMGAGTTAVVAEKLGRDWIGIEINPEYIKIAKRRLAKLEQDLFSTS